MQVVSHENALFCYTEVAAAKRDGEVLPKMSAQEIVAFVEQMSVERRSTLVDCMRVLEASHGNQFSVTSQPIQHTITKGWSLPFYTDGQPWNMGYETWSSTFFLAWRDHH